MTDVKFYCVKCRKKVSMDQADTKLKVYHPRVKGGSSKGRTVHARKAVHSKCGTNLTVFVKAPK